MTSLSERNPVPHTPTEQNYPWAVTRIAPDEVKPTIVRRFMNRQDAEDNARFMRRLLGRTGFTFEVMFVWDEEQA